MTELGFVWVVAGAPGAGKSYFADRFIPILSPAPALIDKDTMYNPLVDSVLLATGRSMGERESDWHDAHIKPHTYAGMSAVARQICSNGCDVVLSAPYTDALYEPGAWEALVERLGGGPASLIWIRSDAKTLHSRLRKRGYARDGDKLANFDAYAASMHLDVTPVAPHVEIDNRFCAALPMDEALGEAFATTLR